MAMCGAVQKASRPIERCHEMSQWPPTIAEVTATTVHQTNQGIDGVRGGLSAASITIYLVANARRQREHSRTPRLRDVAVDDEAAEVEPRAAAVEDRRVRRDRVLAARQDGVGVGHDLGVDGEGPAVGE